MLFSVLIPVYNTSRYLDECVSSVLRQTENDYEIVLLDDGSTDDSPAICDRYAEQNSQIRVIHKPNEGLMMTRRRGFKEAKGEYFICLDSDDYWTDENMLGKIRAMIEKERCDMVLWDYTYGATPTKPERRITLFEHHPDGYVFDEATKTELYDKLLAGAFLNPMWIKALKRDIVDIDVDYSPWKGDICRGEDNFQSFPLLNNANRIGYMKQPFNYYRQIPSAISYNPKLQFYDAYRRIFLRENEYLETWNVTEEIKTKARTKRVTRFVEIITTGLQRSNTNKKKKEWVAWVRKIGKDSFFATVYKTAKCDDVLPYYRVICTLVIKGLPRLTAMEISITGIIHKFKHKR